VRVASETSARLATLEGESVGVKKKKQNRRSRRGGQTHIERRHGERGEGGED